MTKGWTTTERRAEGELHTQGETAWTDFICANSSLFLHQEVFHTWTEESSEGESTSRSAQGTFYHPERPDNSTTHTHTHIRVF